jgi:hypothetical protein
MIRSPYVDASFKSLLDPSAVAKAEETKRLMGPSLQPRTVPGHGQGYCMAPLPSPLNPQYIAACTSQYHRTSTYNKRNYLLQTNEICTHTYVYGVAYVTAKMTPTGPRYALVGQIE